MRAGGGAQAGLQVDSLVKETVTEEDDQREETQLEVVRFPGGLCLICTDDKERKENGEEAAADDIGGLHGCEGGEGQTKAKVIRPVPLNVR